MVAGLDRYESTRLSFFIFLFSLAIDLILNVGMVPQFSFKLAASVCFLIAKLAFVQFTD